MLISNLRINQPLNKSKKQTGHTILFVGWKAQIPKVTF